MRSLAVACFVQTHTSMSSIKRFNELFWLSKMGERNWKCLKVVSMIMRGDL